MIGRERAWGLDLGVPGWWASEREHDGRGLVPTREPVRLGLPPLMSDPTVEAELRLGPASDPSALARTNWVTLRARLNEIGNAALRAVAAGDEAHIGLAVPRTMPPALRWNLPALFGLRLAPAKGGYPTRPGLFTLVEAPIALTWEALALGRIRPPANLVVRAGGEWTAVRLGKPMHDTSGEPPVLEVHLGRAIRPDSARPDGPDEDALFLVAGDAPPDIPADRLIGMPSEALADGAARIALAHEQAWSRTSTVPFQPASSSVAPAPIGAIGQGHGGEWFWRRLVAAGEPLRNGGEPHARIVSDDPGPRDVAFLLFAECLSPQWGPARWIARTRWDAAELRVHSTDNAIARPPVPGRTRHAWTFTLGDLNARIRWGQVQWTIGYEPPG